jgi:DNA polymerase-3 subunit epsilon
MALKAIFFDTETTGTDTNKDRVIEIAAFAPDTGAIFEMLINPQMAIPPEASAMHHITNHMVAHAPPFGKAIPDFFTFCAGEVVLIGHNCERFDIPMLQSECKRANIAWPKLRWLDSLVWARRYRKDLPRHSLQYLRSIYGITPLDAHRALNDVMILHQVFCAMIDDLNWDAIYKLLYQKSTSTTIATQNDAQRAAPMALKENKTLYLFT